MEPVKAGAFVVIDASDRVRTAREFRSPRILRNGLSISVSTESVRWRGGAMRRLEGRPLLLSEVIDRQLLLPAEAPREVDAELDLREVAQLKPVRMLLQAIWRKPISRWHMGLALANYQSPERGLGHHHLQPTPRRPDSSHS
jgi:hypothetical protein